jgi:hypothetical protein
MLFSYLIFDGDFKKKMATSLEVPPGTRLMEKELHLRPWTKMKVF